MRIKGQIKLWFHSPNIPYKERKQIFACSGTFLCTLMFDFTNVSAVFFHFCIKIICIIKKFIFVQFSDMQVSWHGYNWCYYIWKIKLYIYRYLSWPQRQWSTTLLKEICHHKLKSFWGIICRDHGWAFKILWFKTALDHSRIPTESSLHRSPCFLKGCILRCMFLPFYVNKGLYASFLLGVLLNYQQRTLNSLPVSNLSIIPLF